jgi:pyruvate dehydrogenase E2 component (dihydrolipoamide acetyltransferase)/putative redox protein
MAEGLSVTARWRGGYRADVTARGHEVAVDEPVHSGGEDKGFMPTELFCGALASCFCLAIGHVARKRALDVPDLRVTVRSERAARELRYARLVVECSAGVEDETLDRLIERARPFCWVSNTLAAGVEVEYRRLP